MPPIRVSRLLPAITVAALLALPVHGSAAQAPATSMTASCTPFVGCSSLRFFLTVADAALSLEQLTLTLDAGGFRFASPFGVGNPGTYAAEDKVGPFGGSTTIAAGGASLFIDFLGENGFAFELDAGGTGFVDLEVEPAGAEPGNEVALAFSYEGVTADGPIAGRHPQTDMPEPGSLAVVGAGLAALAWRRRRAADA